MTKSDLSASPGERQINLFVHIRSMVAHVGSQSITVLVSVQAEDPVRGEFYDTVRAFLTYTPLKVKSGIARIPPLACVGEEEEALFHEVESRILLQRIIAG
jgi:acyl-CoA hydrolase